MPDPGTPTAGTLVKLLIQGYSEPTATSGLVGSISAVINPETYTLSYNIAYEQAKTLGASAPTEIFTRMSSGDFDLELLADGTGVVPLPAGVSSVDDYVQQMMDIVYDYQGDSNNAVMFEIQFKGIGAYGERTGTFLRNAILGYQ